jgi:hypothetical protein
MLITTPRILLGLGLTAGGMALLGMGITTLFEEASETVAQREFLADIVAKNLDNLNPSDREALRKLGIGIKKIEG